MSKEKDSLSLSLKKKKRPPKCCKVCGIPFGKGRWNNCRVCGSPTGEKGKQRSGPKVFRRFIPSEERLEELSRRATQSLPLFEPPINC